MYWMSKYLTLLKIRIPSSVPWIFSGVAERAGEAKEKAKVLWVAHFGASKLTPALGVWWGQRGIARRQELLLQSLRLETKPMPGCQGWLEVRWRLFASGQGSAKWGEGLAYHQSFPAQ